MPSGRYTLLPLLRDWTPDSRGPRSWRTPRWLWVLGGLGLVTMLSFIVLRDNHPQVCPQDDQTLTPLDDFQMLKPHFTTWTGPATNTSDANSRAVVTTLYNDLFTIPAATLGHSLQKAGTNARRILLHIPGRLSSRALCIVRAAGWEPHPVEFIPPPHDGVGIGYRFVDQYTKLRIWTLDTLGIERLVYLDSDTLVRRNFDELFSLPFEFGAVADVWGEWGFKLHFNAGVLAIRPDSVTFAHMLSRLNDARYPPSEAEQAFLNLYFGADAVRLPYVYNANLAIRERGPALWEALRDELRVVHYTLPKPFPAVGEGIMEGEDLELAIHNAEHDRGGVHAEAISWWVSAYNEFKTQSRDELEQCDRQLE